MQTFIVLLGPPGAGKGTQAIAISEKLNIPHVSSGDLFRENLRNETDLGKLAKSYMSRGELVPDEVTISMVREKLARADCAQGALLDGFPRTPAQAVALDSILQEFGSRVNWVPYINVPDEVLIERLTGRWTCRVEPAHIYNLKTNPPARPGVCDLCGGELYQRDDDKLETVQNRIKVYMAQTMPLIEYYRKAGVLVEVDGLQGIEKVSSDLLAAITKPS
jgi:adenylate kinase